MIVRFVEICRLFSKLSGFENDSHLTLQRTKTVCLRKLIDDVVNLTGKRNGDNLFVVGVHVCVMFVLAVFFTRGAAAAVIVVPVVIVYYY